MKRIIGVLVVLAVFGAAGWYGAAWWTHGRFVESTDDAYVHSDIANIAPRVAGQVVAVAVADNSTVAEGAVLFRIDDADYKVRVAEAEAALASAHAAVEVIDRRLELSGSEIARAEAGVAAARAERSRAGGDLSRYVALNKSAAASTQRLETARADARKAEASLAEAEADLATARGQVPVLRANRGEALAQIASADARLAAARLDLDHTVVHAPRAGVVANRAVEVGEYVKPGQTALAIVPLPETYVVANFKETQLGAMRPGQPVVIEVDALGGREIHGTVESLSPASGSRFSLLPPENATGNFTKIVQRVPVRITVDDTDDAAHLLVPGLSVVVAVDTSAAPDAASHRPAYGLGASAAPRALAQR
jgi:membrane fusion protein (multidrug efflux system)